MPPVCPSSPSRFDAAFNRLRQAGRCGLATFITAGDPNPTLSAQILAGLAAAGADIIELGIPFSDPMADGPAIQESSKRALDAGMTLAGVLTIVHDYRRHDSVTPIILMGYANPIFAYGPERFAIDAASAGVDGLIVVDTPHEENALILAPAQSHGLAPIPLIAPTTGIDRLKTLLRHAEGFIYYITITGVTGSALRQFDRIKSDLARLHDLTTLPIATGFGIQSPEDVAAMSVHADLVVVGSAIVSRIAAIDANNTDDCQTLFAFIRSLADALQKRPGL